MKLLLHEVEPNPRTAAAASGLPPVAVNTPRLADGFTPLHCAAAVGDEAMVLALLERGADPTKRYGRHLMSSPVGFFMHRHLPPHLPARSPCDRDFRRRLPHMVAPSTAVLTTITKYFQANSDVWPHRVVGVLPGMRKQTNAGGKGNKGKGNKSKGKGKARRRAKAKGATGTGAPKPASEDALLDAAVASVQSAHAMASARASEVRSQMDIASSVRTTAAQLRLSEVELLSMLVDDVPEGLNSVRMALDAGMSRGDILASFGRADAASAPAMAAAPTSPVAAHPPAAPAAATAAPAATAAAATPTTPVLAPAPTKCVVCDGVVDCPAGGSEPLCGDELCRRRHRASLMAAAAARRMAQSPSP